MEVNIERALQRGNEAFKAGRIQDAERLYRSILRAQPAHADANHNLGQLAVFAGNARAALLLFEAAVEANPAVKQFWLSYIGALIKERQFDNASLVIERAKAWGVNSAGLTSSASQLPSACTPSIAASSSPIEKQLSDLAECFQSGRFEEAENRALQIIQKCPEQQIAWKVLGAVFKATSRNSEAAGAYRTAAALAPKDAEVHCNLGNTLIALGNLAEAEVAYRKAIELRPHFGLAHANLGVALKEQGKLDEAQASYNTSIELNPEVPEFHSNLGSTLKLMGRLDEAWASYQRAIAIRPDHVQFHNDLGATLQQSGRQEEAIDSYNRAIALNPDFALSHNNLGVTLAGLGRFHEAEASYTRAISLMPDNANFHLNLGNALKELGRLDEAVACFSKAITLRSDYAGAHNNLGNTLKEIGRRDQAEASYSRAITIAPDFAEARENLGVLLFESGKYIQAKVQFEQAGLPLSRFFGLQCYYLLSEEETFHKEYDRLVSLGEVNAVLGSLGVRSELKFGTQKINPFCKDPLNYVVNTDLSELCDFKRVFSNTVTDVLSDSSIAFKAQGHLTNGIQTAGNIFSQGKVRETEIENIIRCEIEKYRLRFAGSEEGFVRSWPSSYEIRGWIVQMQSGGTLAPHMHDDGWITGSIYINVAPKAKVNSGNLVLSLTGEGDLFGVDSHLHRVIDVRTGDLCLFPSSLLHHTLPFESTEDRIVLAFDVIPRRNN